MRLIAIVIASLAGSLSCGPGAFVQDGEKISACVQNLRSIGRALADYRNKHDDGLPDRLQDLYPKYLKNKTAFHCPADDSEGRPVFRPIEAGEMPISYLYEMIAEPDGSGSDMLGPSPTTKNPTWREVKMCQRNWFGDRVPVVRCHHHDQVTNLTLDGRIYISSAKWESDPSTLGEVLKCLQRDLAKGPQAFRKRWTPDLVAGYFRSLRQQNDGIAAGLRLKVRSVASTIVASAGSGAPQKDYDLQFMSGNMFYAAGDVNRAVYAFEQAALFEPERPRQETLGKLDKLYPVTNRLDRPIRFYQLLVDEFPRVAAFMLKLADAYDAAGQTAKAEAWRSRAGQIRQ
jgi:tetratricopeptide (TPR) repeat protein